MTQTRSKKAMSVEAAALLLGVDSGASLADVMHARRTQAKLWHPDINPGSGSVERMGLINRATDVLCDHIRAGGYIEGVPRIPTMRGFTPPAPQPRVFEVSVGGKRDRAVGAPVTAPDRLARLELDAVDALQGVTRTVRFVRREPRSCVFCAGLGATPSGPKRVCPDCRGGVSVACATCQGRGWIFRHPGSCTHCDGSGAALVERSVRLVLPAGIDGERRAFVPGWGDVAEDGSSGNLWVDLVPSTTALASHGPWRFEHYGHNWPRPEGRVESGWVAISNAPLPDEEMRELGFWRDRSSSEWVRESPTEGAQAILDLIRQRQFFVPQ
jgi:DnaJ-class molecular chaperone